MSQLTAKKNPIAVHLLVCLGLVTSVSPNSCFRLSYNGISYTRQRDLIQAFIYLMSFIDFPKNLPGAHYSNDWRIYGVSVIRGPSTDGFRAAGPPTFCFLCRRDHVE